MSEIKDLIDLIERVLPKLIPFFQKTNKNIQLYKDLKDETNDEDEKKLLDSKIRDLKVFRATKGSLFTYKSMMNFNKKHPTAHLHSSDFKFMSRDEHELIKIIRDKDNEIIEIVSVLSKQEAAAKHTPYLKHMLTGLLFVFIPAFINNDIIFKKILNFILNYFPMLSKFINNIDYYFLFLSIPIMIGIFIIIYTSRNVLDLIKLQDLMKKNVIQEPQRATDSKKLELPKIAEILPTNIAEELNIDSKK